MTSPRLRATVAPVTTLDYESPSPPRVPSGTSAALWLVLATVFWGCGFSWAKSAQQEINAAAGTPSGALGPILLLAIRFTIAGALWMLINPISRRGWTWASVRRAVILGGLLAGGLILQHLALERSTEAVVAFLTTLSIVFVPVAAAILLRRPPHWAVWCGVAVALVGTWRMTGGSPRGFGWGELLGVGCAAVFSVHLLALGPLVRQDSPHRMTGGQFLIIGLCCWGALCIPGESSLWSVSPGAIGRAVLQREVLFGLGMLVVLGTMASFTIMIFYQPLVDPTRAALIYLLEPVWAGLYMWVFAQKSMSPTEMQGAAMVIAANACVELFTNRKPAGAPLEHRVVS